jgi:hypothetical protein
LIGSVVDDEDRLVKRDCFPAVTADAVSIHGVSFGGGSDC